MQKELNLKQKWWLKLLKNCDMILLYHSGKANLVADTLNMLSMGSFSHVEMEKKELLKDIH